MNSKNTMESKEVDGSKMLAESKFFLGYSRWSDDKQGYETWEESIARVMNMHRLKYETKLTPKLEEFIEFAQAAYNDKLVLGAQRALQFGGEQLRKHEARMYNCSSSHCDRPAFFAEAMYLLLCGCGVGFSVQKHHIDKLPAVTNRDREKVKIFHISDSIEGWADAFSVLLSSYFVNGAPFPTFKGRQVHFDFSEIRPKGALISGGFKAPGPEPLRQALIRCEALLDGLVANQEGSVKLTPIVAYDFVMHMADAVLAGGVRRSATICLFDKDDKEMLQAKTGNWFYENPQRGRSNNSVMLLRDQLQRDEWANIVKSVKEFGEPGFVFTDNLEFTVNPCVEIGMLPVTKSGVSGFQFCNLTEINGGKCTSEDIFLRACKAAAILGSLQAGYTDFRYLSNASREITEREALLGVSITGWMNNPQILFNEELLLKGAQIVKETNREIAALLGIKPAARTTCAKPSGNASVLLGTASGIHGEHASRYFRNVQMSVKDEVAQLILSTNPKMVETSVWSANNTDVVVSFPVISKKSSVYRKDLMGIKLLEYVKKAQQTWVEEGTNEHLCRDARLRHNISNTISVDNWDEIEQYIFDNRQWFAGISLMSASGDRGFPQAPFTEVYTANEILDMYGNAGLFASGLIVDALHAFNENLWKACDTAVGLGTILTEDSSDLLRRDWVRRFKKFADNFFDGDLAITANCLKDCYNLHKWVGITGNLRDISFATELTDKRMTEVDTLGSQGCSGGACEITLT